MANITQIQQVLDTLVDNDDFKYLFYQAHKGSIGSIKSAETFITAFLTNWPPEILPVEGALDERQLSSVVNYIIYYLFIYDCLLIYVTYATKQDQTFVCYSFTGIDSIGRPLTNDTINLTLLGSADKVRISFEFPTRYETHYEDYSLNEAIEKLQLRIDTMLLLDSGIEKLPSDRKVFKDLATQLGSFIRIRIARVNKQAMDHNKK